MGSNIEILKYEDYVKGTNQFDINRATHIKYIPVLTKRN